MRKEDFVFVIHSSEENRTALNEDGTTLRSLEQNGGEKPRQTEEEQDAYPTKSSQHIRFYLVVHFFGFFQRTLKLLNDFRVISSDIVSFSSIFVYILLLVLTPSLK